MFADFTAWLLPFFNGIIAPMSDDDDPLEAEFKAACSKAIAPDEWMICPTGDTDYEKGVRRGLEVVLLTIRDTHGTFDLCRNDDGSYELSLQIYEDHLRYCEDFATVIQVEVDMNKGDDDAIRAFSAYLRAQADEVDKAIGWKPKPRFKKEALEEEP